MISLKKKQFLSCNVHTVICLCHYTVWLKSELFWYINSKFSQFIVDIRVAMARGGSLFIFNVLCLIIFKVKYQNHCKQIKISCNKMLQVKIYRLYCLSCMIIQDLKIDDKRKIPVYFQGQGHHRLGWYI